MAVRKSKADLVLQYERIRDGLRKQLNDGRISKARRERLYARFERVSKAFRKYSDNITQSQRTKDLYTSYNRKYSHNTYMGLNQR